MKSDAYVVDGRLLRLTSGGMVKSEHRRVRMSMEDGHFYPRKVWNAPTQKVITAIGFAHLSSMAGFTYISPGTIIDDTGREVGNPIIRRENGFVSYVRVRRIGIGRASNGDLRAIDRTLTYDVLAYYYNDLYMAFSDKNKEGDKWGHVMNIQYAQEMIKQEANRSRAIAFAAPGVALVYDTSHKEVKIRIRENHQRALFGDRLAVTVCDRNIAKAHFGFANVPEDGYVNINCWPMADMDWEKIRNGLSARSGVIDLMGEKVEIEVQEDELTEEDVTASESAVDTDDGVNRPLTAEEDQSQEWHATVGDIRNCYWHYIQKLGKEPGNAKFLVDAGDMLAKHKTSLAELANLESQEAIDDIFNAVDVKKLAEELSNA